MSSKRGITPSKRRTCATASSPRGPHPDLLKKRKWQRGFSQTRRDIEPFDFSESRHAKSELVLNPDSDNTYAMPWPCAVDPPEKRHKRIQNLELNLRETFPAEDLSVEPPTWN